MAPEFGDDAVSLPLDAILDWTMGTAAGSPASSCVSDTLAPQEVLTVDGIAVTTPARTAFDIGRRTLTRLHAVQRLDALVNATDVKIADVEAVIDEHAGARGLVRLRRSFAAGRRRRGISAGDANPAGVDRRGPSAPSAQTQTDVSATSTGALCVARRYGSYRQMLRVRHRVRRTAALDGSRPARPGHRRYTALLDRAAGQIIRVSSELLAVPGGHASSPASSRAMHAAGWRP